MALIMIIVSSITFFIVRWLPGDPVFLWVGDHPTKEQIDRARSDLGLNQPLHKQYLSFLKKNRILGSWCFTSNKTASLKRTSKQVFCYL